MTQGSFAAALTGAVVLACVAGGISAVAASAIAEQFPVPQRLSGLALGATAATALFGGLTGDDGCGHDKTVTRLVTEAGGTWSRYAPGDHTR
ncbi:hypothetical protein [Streptomyces sp. NPDC002324]